MQFRNCAQIRAAGAKAVDHSTPFGIRGGIGRFQPIPSKNGGTNSFWYVLIAYASVMQAT